MFVSDPSYWCTERKLQNNLSPSKHLLTTLCFSFDQCFDLWLPSESSLGFFYCKCGEKKSKISHIKHKYPSFSYSLEVNSYGRSSRFSPGLRLSHVHLKLNVIFNSVATLLGHFKDTLDVLGSQFFFGALAAGFHNIPI